MEILFLPFMIFVGVPPLAVLPAVLLALCFFRHRLRLDGSKKIWVLTGAGAWLLYAVYESVIWFWSKGVVAPIRIDLLLIAPVLYVLSFLSIRACWKAKRTNS